MLIFCIVNSSSLLGCIKTDLCCCREAAWEDTTAKVTPFPALDLGAKTRSKRFSPSATGLKSKSSPVHVQSLAWRWRLRRQATYQHSCNLTFLQWQGLATECLLTALDSGLQLQMKVPYMDVILTVDVIQIFTNNALFKTIAGIGDVGIAKEKLCHPPHFKSVHKMLTLTCWLA